MGSSGFLWDSLEVFAVWSFLESIAGFFRIFFTNLTLLGLLRILEGFLAACFRIFFKLSRFFYQRSWGFLEGFFRILVRISSSFRSVV